MKNRFYALLAISLLILLSGCGSVDQGTTDNSDNDNCLTGIDDSTIDDSDGKLRVVGQITYDRVPVNSNGVGLNYNKITKEPAKQVVVKLMGDGENTYETTTDNSGYYEFVGVSKNSCVKILALAKLEKSGTAGWNLKVLDNTNANALYAISSSSYSIDSDSIRVNLNASSGWDGFSYSSTRSAAPFAILGSIYQSMQKVIDVNRTTIFPDLVVHWSKNNVAAVGSVADGQIQTSHFDGSSLYILGDADGGSASDTDEYDDHVVIHEWGHYFEAMFSRTDSIGGGHGFGEKLDIRVAFGEGWGNAWSAIVTDNPIYYDTLGSEQSSGWKMDIENQHPNNPGWYSESSIQRILYDLYDSNSDGQDMLSLGFAPLYKVLVGPQKNTEAFTSIFPFITALKKELPTKANMIDNLLSSENINSITNIYGDNHYDLYSELQIGDVVRTCTSNQYGKYNKLNNRKYIKFAISQSGTYTIKVNQAYGNSANPNFILYRATSPFTKIKEVDRSLTSIETYESQLSKGNYILDIFDYNNLNTCFDVTVNQ